MKKGFNGFAGITAGVMLLTAASVADAQQMETPGLRGGKGVRTIVVAACSKDRQPVEALIDFDISSRGGREALPLNKVIPVVRAAWNAIAAALTVPEMEDAEYEEISSRIIGENIDRVEATFGWDGQMETRRVQSVENIRPLTPTDKNYIDCGGSGEGAAPAAPQRLSL